MGTPLFRRLIHRAVEPVWVREAMALTLRW
jgi:hypothetical protein